MLEKFITVGAREAAMTIEGAPISEYSIVVPTPHKGMGPLTMPPSVEFAARELQKYIARLTGITLPIAGDKNPIVKECELVVGECTTRALPEEAPFAPDEYAYRTVGKKIFFRGGQRGVIYAVYRFLEDEAGIRFLTPDVEKIRGETEIKISGANVRYNPPFFYREVCYWTAWDPDYSVKRGINGGFVRKLDAAHGGGMAYAGGFAGLVHTFSHLLPESEFYADHPEYYALTDEGKRDPSGLCLTNPDTHREVVKHLRRWLDESGEKMVSISINDGDVAYCRCENCRKISEDKNDFAPQVLRFVCDIARELKDDYPDVWFDTIVYGKVQNAPEGIDVPDNVVVRVCGWSERSASAYDENVRGVANFRRKIEEWGKIVPRLFVWDYPAPYHEINTVFPQFSSLPKNAKYFVDHNVRGILINGNAETVQFTEFTIYMISLLCWNPNLGEEGFRAKADEFLEAYYGAGWKHIRAFMDYTEKIAAKSWRTSSHSGEIIPLKKGDKIDRERIDRLKKYFTDAATFATPAERHRIKKASLQVDYMELYATMDEILDRGTDAERLEVVAKNRALYEDLKRFGIPRIVENCFLPVVKEFRQSPAEWSYWDPAAVCADKNNDNYDRDLYLLIPSELPKGTVTDVTFELRTSNVNPDCKCEALGAGGTFESMVPMGPLVWEIFRHYRPCKIRGAVVTDLAEFAEAEGYPEDREEYRLINRWKRGIMLRFRSFGAGAYVMVRSVDVKPR